MTQQTRIVKVDEDRHLVFGWASRVGVDKQGDLITADELEEAGYRFMLRGGGADTLHNGVQVGRVVECMSFTKEKQRLLGVDMGEPALWIGLMVDDEETWQRVRSGELREFSIGGHADVEEMGV